MSTVGPSLRHLIRMTGPDGIAEHARFAQPRWELGVCTDDVGRALAMASCRPRSSSALLIVEASLRFLERAHMKDGVFHLRLLPGSGWTSDLPSDDANGRAIYGLGVAAARAPWPRVRREAAVLFHEATAFRSPYPRATAYAALGAAELLNVDGAHEGAAAMVADAATTLPAPRDGSWPWPEPRLSYANALIPEALIAIGRARGNQVSIDQGLELLLWLLEVETTAGRFSFTPTGGWALGEPRPGFDQQPIEAASMADACARAFGATGDPVWLAGVERAAAWFIGRNDTGSPMWDRDTDGGFDGLQRDGVNRNEGAESTIALLSTWSLAYRLLPPASLGRLRADQREEEASASSR